jgi:adenylyltransferase/sulfurtransferase
MRLAVRRRRIIMKRSRVGVPHILCVHRVGELAIDLAVWVGASALIATSVCACRYVIDEVKHRVPIWKKSTT